MQNLLSREICEIVTTLVGEKWHLFICLSDHITRAFLTHQGGFMRFTIYAFGLGTMKRDTTLRIYEKRESTKK